MTERSRKTQEVYVAPAEPIAPRRPPITEVGVIHWMRENLFSSWTDTIITLITGVLIGYLLWSALSWALLQAQWEIVFLNLRPLGVGNAFPSSEVWRVEVSAFILIFLALMSVAVWGMIRSSIVSTLAIIAVAMIIIPPLTEPVPEPAIFVYTDADYENRQMNFLAEAGQDVGFTIDPLTSVDEFQLDTISGYIENNNQQANTSFDAYSQASTEITFQQTRDPEQYDLSLSVQVWNADGAVIYESPFTEGTRENTDYMWTAPATGWYTLTIVRDDETSTTGAAWLKVDNVEVFRSTVPAQRARDEQFGPQPDHDCRNCGTSTNRTDMRFEGKRTIPQWFSLQLTPFILEVRQFFFYGLIVGAAGYILGKLLLRTNFSTSDFVQNTERQALNFGLVFFIAYIALQIATLVYPQPVWDEIRLFILIAFGISIVVYALAQFLKPGTAGASRGVVLLWLLSIPVIMTIITGFPVDANTTETLPLPEVRSQNFGGVLLTIVLAATAIGASFPIGVMLALGRQSSLPVVSLLCTIFIEVVRGVPLITLLFMGRLILPFFGFGLGDVDLLVRIAVMMTFFTAAYMAEVVRGGLQTIPKGQLEASYALGLNDFWTTTLIVLPQALRAVIPAIMGQAVSLFKDTSLVFIVGLFEILGTMNQILGDSQTGYTAFPREGYLYIGAVYFVISYIMADVSRRLERTGSGAIRRDTI